MNRLEKPVVIGARSDIATPSQRVFSKRWLTTMLFILVGAVIADAVADVILQDGFEDRPVELDCEKFNYPCSLSDANPDALDRADALLDELWNIRKGGTLDDCHDHLLNQADVVLVFRGDTSLVFQVDGMMPVVFHEIPVPPAPASIPDLKATKDKGAARIAGAGPIHSIRKSTRSDAAGTLRVVGEDSNQNGIIDQRDAKNAVLLSPYEWLSSVSWGTDELASILNDVRGYQGNVLVLSNLTETDDNVGGQVWADLSPADVLIINTFVGTASVMVDGQEQSWSWVSSGIPASDPSAGGLDVEVGLSIGVHFSQSEELDPIVARRFALGADYFRYREASKQRDKLQLMVFSNGSLAPDMGNSFQHVSRYHALSVIDGTSNDENRNSLLLEMFQWLAQGLKLGDAFSLAIDGTAGISIDFSEYKSGLSISDQARIIELPRLFYGGMEAPLGFPLHSSVTGTVGDGMNDKLQLTLQIDGVTEETKPDFKIRYRISQKSVPGSFGLEQAELVSGFDYRYELTQMLELGFPLQPGPVPIEIVIDLPEGGESRYTGLGSLAACHFYARFSGEVSGAFAGPAGYNINHEGKYGFFFRSTEFIWALDPLEFPVWQADIDTDYTDLPAPGEYMDVASSDLNLGLNNYIYFPEGGDGFTCDTCGGEFWFDHETAEGSIAGATGEEKRIRMTRPPYPSDPPGYEPQVDLNIWFIAAEGSLTDGDSPFFDCAIEYDP